MPRISYSRKMVGLSILLILSDWRQSDGFETKLFQSVRQPASVDPVFLAIFLYDAVESAKQKDRREARVINRPCPSHGPTLQQLEKMVDDDIVNEAFAWRRIGSSVENNVVEPNGIQITGDTRLGPGC